MNKTRIEWCDYTWNPLTGCLHGCPYCYARRMARRFCTNEHGHEGPLAPCDGECHACSEMDGIEFLGDNLRIARKGEGPFPYGFMPTLHRYRLEEPAHKAKSAVIFVCSMADLFGEWVPDEWIGEVLTACQAAPQHQYIFLTKNPRRYEQLAHVEKLPSLPNFWYGNSVTSQADAYIPRIRANRFLSIEPLLKPIAMYKTWDCHICQVVPPQSYGRGEHRHLGHPAQGPSHYQCGGNGMAPDWVIIGAETGNRKEKVTPAAEWIKALAAECKEYRIPVFMKDSVAEIIAPKKLQRELPPGIVLHTKGGRDQ